MACTEGDTKIVSDHQTTKGDREEKKEKRRKDLALGTDERRGADELHGVTKRSLLSDASEGIQSLGHKVDVFLGATNLKDLLEFIRLIRGCGDDEKTIQKVHRDAMRALIVGAADARDASV